MNKKIVLLEKWEKELSKLTGVTISIILNDGSILLPGEISTEFCTKMQSQLHIGLGCQWNRLLAITHFHFNRTPIRYLCPFGMVSVAIPILDQNDHLIAILFAGQRRVSKEYESELPYLTKKAGGFPDKEFEKLYEKVPIVDQEHIDNIMPILELFAEAIGERITEDEIKNLNQSVTNHISDDELMNLIDLQLKNEAKYYFNLDDLEQIFKRKKKEISRVIKKYRNSTFVPYYQRIKVQQANHLLVTTDYPVTKISEYLGFVDNARFCKVFKQETGLTPSAYRSKYCMKKNRPFA
ncbi:Helix-turn-helix domain-containing protein [Pilibacter termitis]|uniref:Helix-turn-helix domain-containing protein n=1 Tax=Pilibacter termitis TaxID=263852 RepID=A0A1T4M4I7_9ENTE|nr:PocR ligand-binding domain-containing protein [Pilibacter termitis]SJZ61873.1 Helix-turn-helix domain-containing protein [Pilibacter termitis]